MIGHTSGNAEIVRGLSMNLQSFNSTITLIAEESNQQPNESGQHKVLLAWRAKLAEAPTSLPQFKIDEIVREARKRLTAVSR